MFQDPWQIQTDGSGKPIGIEPQVYQDIDAALQLAETYDLYYTFVLFEFPRNIPSSWMSNVEHREALGQVLGELFANYAGSSRIFAWEVFNEPEWDMWNNVVPAQPVVDTAAVIVDAIHANSSALATVGNAMVDGISYWTEIGLDFYSPHWYDYMQPGGWCAYCRTADSVRTQYGINAPIVIGEFYAGSDVGGDTRYQQFHDLGYAGAWAWSLFPERTNDGMTIDLDGLASYASRYSNIGPSSASSPTVMPGPTIFDEPNEAPPPTQEPTLEPTPAPTAEPTPIPTGEPTVEPTAEPSPEPTTAPVEEPAAPPALEPGFTTSATAPTSVSAGSTASITFNVTSGTTKTVLLDIEIYGADGTKVFQDWVDGAVLDAGVKRSFSFTWPVPGDHPEGSYSVVVAVFEPGWAKNLVWNAGAAEINVVSAVSPSPPPPPEPTAAPEVSSEPIVSSVTVGDGSIAPGQRVENRTSVFSDTTLNVLLDIEIYDANGNRVFQVWRDNRNLGVDKTKTFRNVWGVPWDLPPGEYTVAIGVFGLGWDGLYDWNVAAGSFTVTK